MAKLGDEQLTIEITNMIQLDLDGNSNFYERFDISITIHQQPVFPNQVLANTYELMGGNIQLLIEAIDSVLND